MVGSPRLSDTGFNHHNPDPKEFERNAKGLRVNRSFRSLVKPTLLFLVVIVGLFVWMALKQPPV